MSKKTKTILALLLVLAAMLNLSACGKKGLDENEIPDSTGGTEIVKGKSADERFTMNVNIKYSRNPLVATNRSNQLICDLVYENMIELDDRFQVIEGSGVITEWECSDDAKNWTLTVGEGHTFHDGSPVTPRDISYSLGLAINSDRYAGRFASYQGASPGEGVVYVTLGIGDASFIRLLNIPVIKSGTYGEKRDYGNTPIGSGPYTYNEDGSKLIAAETWPDYENLPVQEIYLKEYKTADEIISAFESGAIDVVTNDPSSYTNLGYASTNEVHTYATTNMHYVMFNEESMLGRYSNFRLAMQHAFDREYLVELLHGNAVASPFPMYPTCPDYPTALVGEVDYDLQDVVKVLSSAYVRDSDGDGIMEFDNGGKVPVEINIAVCADSSAKAGVVRRFQEDMASIGLTVVVHEMTWDNYIKALEEGEIAISNTGEQTVTLDMYYGEVKLRANFDLTELLQPRKESNEMTNINFSRSTDATVVDRIERYLSASNAARPGAYYEFCQYLTKTSASLITIGFEKQQIITRRGVCKGVEPNAGNPLYNFQNWTIDLKND